MSYSIQKTDNLILIYALHTEIFPGDFIYVPEPTNKAHYWVIVDNNANKMPVGFAIGTELPKGEFFLARGGVYMECRGKKIHSRLIKVRENFAKKNGFKNIVTYVSPDNHASLARLIKNDYKLYTPATLYVGKHYLYLYKSINNGGLNE